MERTTLSARFGINGKSRDLNLILQDKDGKDDQVIASREQVERLAFEIKEMHNMELYGSMRERREFRAQQIHAFFRKCANTIIDEIEGSEGWHENGL